MKRRQSKVVLMGQGGNKRDVLLLYPAGSPYTLQWRSASRWVPQWSGYTRLARGTGSWPRQSCRPLCCPAAFLWGCTFVSVYTGSASASWRTCSTITPSGALVRLPVEIAAEIPALGCKEHRCKRGRPTSDSPPCYGKVLGNRCLRLS